MTEAAPGRRRPLEAAAVLAALLPAGAVGQQDTVAAPVVRGTVLEAESLRPLPALVELLGANGEVLSEARCDTLGVFFIAPGSPGVYGVRAILAGYRTESRSAVGVWPGDTLRLELRMEPGPSPPDDLEARGSATGQQDGGPLLFGVVIDDANRTPIEAGSVSLVGRDSVLGPVPTREDGTFVIWPDTGTYRIRAEALGYRTAETRTLTFRPADTVQVEVRLSGEAFVLDPLRVVARGVPAGARVGLVGMDDFFDRFARYAGSPFADLMTRDSMAVWDGRAHNTGDMLQWTSRFVRSVDPETGAITLRAGCEPTYYLNGSRVPFEMVRTLSPSLLEAVEVYVQPAIPAKLGQGAPCGVVSFWSRQSPPDNLPKNPLLRRIAGAVLVVGLVLVVLNGLK